MTEVQKQDVPKQELQRLTVNLIPRAHKALLLAAALTGDNRTNTVNRALQFYAYAEYIASKGGNILVREPGAEPQVIKFL